jgi:hypothetical protein
LRARIANPLSVVLEHPDGHVDKKEVDKMLEDSYEK